jgi:hypothetical protein
MDDSGTNAVTIDMPTASKWSMIQLEDNRIADTELT